MLHTPTKQKASVQDIPFPKSSLFKNTTDLPLHINLLPLFLKHPEKWKE